MELLKNIIIYDKDKGGVDIDVIRIAPKKYRLIIDKLEPGEMKI